MASRKEEREQLRAERELREAEKARQERKRMLLGYVVAGVITLAVVVGIVAVIAGGGGGDGGGGSDADLEAAGVDLTSGGIVDGRKLDTREGADIPQAANLDLVSAAKEASCDLRENLADEGNGHLPDGEELPSYDTNPPTSGDHYERWQADGAYAEPLDPGRYIHAMEHGRVVIHYSPKLPEADQLELKGLFEEAPDGMLLAPNREMPYEIAATAWLNLLGCDSYEGAKTLDAIRDFRDAWLARGPEQYPL